MPKVCKKTNVLILPQTLLTSNKNFNTRKSIFIRRRRFKVFCQAFFQKSLRGAECPVDIRPAPTGAKRRPGGAR